VDFDIIDELFIRYSAFVTYMRKNGSIMGQYINYLQLSREPMTQEWSIVEYSH